MTDSPRSETQDRALDALHRAEALLTWPERVRRWAAVYCAAVVTLCAIGLGYVVIGHSSELRQATNASQKSSRTLELLLGCFHPGSPCSKLNAKATRAAFDKFAQVVLLADQCQADPKVGSDYPAQEACLAREMQAHGLR